MADKKITELPISTTLDGTEIVPIVQGGVTSQATTQDIADLGGGTQNLQSVTDAGNTTTNDIQFDAGVGVLLDNTSRLREGTIDAGYGGAKGIAQICAVGYELKWESGSLYVMDGNGTHIRHTLYNFASVPSITEDITKGFLVGTRWSLDNGNVYVCTDNSIGAAVWEFQINAIPTKTSDLINDGDDGNPFISLNDLPSNLILYATNATSDIPTYVKLVSSITDIDYNTTAVDVSTGSITTTNQFISALITSPNVIVGNPGVLNITTIGNIRRTAGTGNAEFYFEVYKRTIGGVETLITTSGNTIPVINTGYAEFSATALWNDGIFLATDRIVLKFYGSRIVGGSNPTYDFQFGGSTPIRSLVPLPLTVIPVLNLDDLQDVTIASIANNEILTYESSTNLWKNKNTVVTTSLTTPIINGVSNLLSFGSTDKVSVGNYATPSAQRAFTVGQDTAFISMGSMAGSTTLSAIYFNTVTPSASNYALMGSTGTTSLNTTNQITFSRSGTTFMLAEFGMRVTWNMTSNSFGYTPFNYIKNAVTGGTASTALPGWNYTGGSTQWATGNITTQSENVWGATTYSFVGASTITNAYGNVFNAPIAGTNCTITNNYAAQFNGNLQINGIVDRIAINYPSLSATYKLGVGGSMVVNGQIIVQDDSGVFAAYSSDGLTQSGGFNFNRYVGVNIYSSNTNPIKFAVNGAEAIRIFNGGNILIQNGGTFTNNGFRLDVNGTGRFQSDLTIGSTGQLIEIKQTATAPTYTQTGSSSSIFRLNAGTRSLLFESYAVDQNYFSSTGARFTIRTTDANTIQFFTNNTSRMYIGGSGNLTFNEANNIEFGTTTGSKIATATTQKIAFWNATPIVQPTTSVTASTFVSNTSAILNDSATFDGYTIGQVVKALRNIGLLA